MNHYQDSPLFTVVVLFLLASGVVLMLVSSVSDPEDKHPVNTENQFEIVSKYKNCDVIQYTPKGKSTYAYFLNCPTK
jgi:hypothetical protein